MAHPLAYCPTCNIAFQTPVFNLGHGPTVLEDVVTNCPEGHAAQILDGSYETIGNNVKAELWIHDDAARKAVLALVERVRRNEITPQQAQVEAEKIKPGLGSIFNPANWSDAIRTAVISSFILAAGSGLTELAKSAYKEHPAIQQSVTVNMPPPPLPAPEAKPPQKTKQPKTGGNRAVQRNQRQKQRTLMNPRR
jgi:hypothetical protein